MGNTKCERCIHYVPEYSPVLKRNVMTCDVVRGRMSCVGIFEAKPKEKKNARK